MAPSVLLAVNRSWLKADATPVYDSSPIYFPSPSHLIRSVLQIFEVTIVLSCTQGNRI